MEIRREQGWEDPGRKGKVDCEVKARTPGLWAESGAVGGAWAGWSLGLWTFSEAIGEASGAVGGAWYPGRS